MVSGDERGEAIRLGSGLGAEDTGGRRGKRMTRASDSQVDCDARRHCEGRAAVGPHRNPVQKKLHFKREDVDEGPLHIHEEEARRGCAHDSNEKTCVSEHVCGDSEKCSPHDK